MLSTLKAFGLDVLNPAIDGKIHRVKCNGSKDKNGWYIAREYKGKIYCTFGDWSTGETGKWSEGNGSTVTAQDKVAWAEIAKIAEAEAKKLHVEAVRKVQEMIDSCSPASPDHPYLVKKGIKPNGALQVGDNLILPMHLSDGTFTGYQSISPDGSKRYLYGMEKKGSAFIIDGKGPICICEGFATGASIHEAAGRKVLCAMDSGNLLYVARAAQKKASDLLVCADNDHVKEAEGKGNAGIKAAKAIKEELGVEYVFPQGIQGTDFNDMAAEKGLEAIKAAFVPQKFKCTSISKIMSTKYKPIRWAVPGIIPEGMTVLAGRPKFGKSWLMLGLAYAVATGGRAWDYAEVEKKSVHYLALEDSERRIQDRVSQMEGYFDQYPENLHIYTDFPRIGDSFADELTAITDRDTETGLIIIDTLQKVRPLTGRKGGANIYQAEYEDYERIQKWSIQAGIPVICIHHTRKGDPSKAGNPFDEMSGSTGIQGVADTLIVVDREKGKNEGKMFVTGREVSEEEYVLRFAKGTMTWSIEKSEDELDTGPFILSTWFASHGEITVEDAAKLWDCNQWTARRKLEELVKGQKMGKEQVQKSRKYIYYQLRDIL